MGRMKRGPSNPVQVIERGQAKSWTARGKMSARICSVVRPRRTCFAGQVLALGSGDYEHFVKRHALLFRQS